MNNNLIFEKFHLVSATITAQAKVSNDLLGLYSILILMELSLAFDTVDQCFRKKSEKTHLKLLLPPLSPALMVSKKPFFCTISYLGTLSSNVCSKAHNLLVFFFSLQKITVIIKLNLLDFIIY